MKRAFTTAVAVCLLVIGFCTAPASGEDGAIFLRTPDISDDGSLITFSYQGDIWICNSDGTEARPLTLHSEQEDNPVLSPDATHIAYAASYGADRDIYLIPVEGGEPERITYGPGDDYPTCFSPDGKFIYYESNRDGGFNDDIYRIPVEGGLPELCVFAPRDNNYCPCISPDGEKLAFCFRSSIAMRKRAGNKTHDTAEVFVANAGAPVTEIERITENMYQDFEPRWSTDGASIYVMSDRDGGSFQVYKMGADGSNAEVITSFPGNGIWDYDVADDGTLVVVCEHKLFVQKPGQQPVELKPDLSLPPRKLERQFETRQASITDFAVSPDEKLAVVIADGDVFVSDPNLNYLMPLTRTYELEENVSWSPDSKYIIFSRLVGGVMRLVRIEVATGEEKVLSKEGVDCLNAQYSPNGKYIFYRNASDDIHIMLSDGSRTKVHQEADLMPLGLARHIVFSGGPEFIIDEDKEKLFYYDVNEDLGSTAYMRDLYKDDKPTRISYLGMSAVPVGMVGNTNLVYNDTLLGKSCAYTVQLVAVNAPSFENPKEKLERLLDPDKKKESRPPQKEKLVINPANIKERTRRAFPSIDSPHFIPALLPSGTALVVSMNIGGSGSLQLHTGNVSTGRLSRGTSLPGLFDKIIISPDGEAYMTAGGQLFRIRTSGRPSLSRVRVSPVKCLANESRRKMAQFEEVFWMLKHSFYDRQYHGLDLNAVYDKYRTLIGRTTTDTEFSIVMNQFLGEFNASHLGFYRMPDINPLRSLFGQPAQRSTPHLGFRFAVDRTDGEYSVKVSDSTLQAEFMGIDEGDEIISVNGVNLEEGVNPYKVLALSGEEQVDLYIQDIDEEKPRRIFMNGMHPRMVGSMNIQKWEQSRVNYVFENSDGDFGYVNLFAMASGDLAKFKNAIEEYFGGYKGVILDFRYNGGGYVANEMVEMLDDEPYLFHRFANGSWIPEDLIRRETYMKPVCGLFNYASYSNAEMMAAAFKLRDLGPSVGLPTAGAVIGTNAMRTRDGDIVALPTLGVYDREGRNLELSPTAPEVIVEMDIRHIMAGEDPQLDRAIEELRKEAEENQPVFKPEKSSK